MDLILKLVDILPNYINHIVYNIYTKKYIIIINKDKINFLFYFLKKNSLYNVEQLQDLYCNDLLSLDFLELKERFQLNYILLNISNGLRLHIKFNVFMNETIVSVFNFFDSSVWLEREIWDLYGVFILGNNDLRRILTDYGFKGSALRKEFPLYGYVEIIYEIEYKSLIFINVELMQEYRSFEFNNPWFSNNI